MPREKPHGDVEDKSKEQTAPTGPPREPPPEMIRRTLLGSGGDQ